MRPWIIEIGIAVASVGAWFGLFGLMLLTSRPHRVSAVPATQELGRESPAVASILANGWDVTEDALAATLADARTQGLSRRRLSAVRLAWLTSLIAEITDERDASGPMGSVTPSADPVTGA